MRRRRLRVCAAALLVVLGLGCRAPVRNYQCGVASADAADAARDAVDTHELWRCNRDVMRRAARGKKFSIRELEAAARFFEELTGIPADLERTGLGSLPGPELGTSLERWDAWYREHGHRLGWDSHTRSVVLEE